MGTIPYRKKKSEKDVTFLMSMKLNRKEFTSSNVLMSNSLSGYRRKAVPEAVFRRCSVKNVLKNLAKFTGKHLPLLASSGVWGNSISREKTVKESF